MKITIHIPDNAVEIAEEYCQRELGMGLQERLQQEADKIICNIIPLMEIRKELRKNLDDFFSEFGKILKEAVNAK